MLQEDSRGASLQQAAGFELAYAGGDDQHFSGEPLGARQIQEGPALLESQIDVEQHDVHRRGLDDPQSVVHRGALADNLDIRLCR